jgi:putative transposase
MTIPPPKFKGKYRIPSNRLKGWDNRTPGYYFITICSKDQLSWFVEVRVDKMILSPAGEIAVNELEKTPDIRSNVLLDTWIVMPNHIHAIIILEETPIAIVETPRRGVS